MTAALREALEWAMPLAESALEDHRLARVLAGHNGICGTDAGGHLVIGLHQSEIDLRDRARAALSAQVPEDEARLVERLRSSAKAFREHPVYTQDGDGCCLTVQADEMDQAADRIEVLSSGQGKV